MRFACLQFDSQLMQVAANQKKAERLLARRLRPGKRDKACVDTMARVESNA